MITYFNDTEVIVVSEEDEQAMLKEYFVDGGRDVEDYDRDTTAPEKPFVVINFLAKVSIE